MKIHFVRNATFVMETGDNRILVDPCLAKKGTLPPYTLLRRPPRLNPLVPVPDNSWPLFRTITAGLVTHCRNGHWDHLDAIGARLFADIGVPVHCGTGDVNYLVKKGVKAVGLEADKFIPFLDGRIKPVPTQHGRGIAGFLMGPGLGFFIELPGQPSLYIAGDTVLTPGVKEVLRDLKPDIAVVNAGTAVLDVGTPILMPLDELIEFINMAPGKVIAVHMDAFNHCITDRKKLRQKLFDVKLSQKVLIPEDGETLDFSVA